MVDASRESPPCSSSVTTLHAIVKQTGIFCTPLEAPMVSQLTRVPNSIFCCVTPKLATCAQTFGDNQGMASFEVLYTCAERFVVWFYVLHPDSSTRGGARRRCG